MLQDLRAKLKNPETAIKATDLISALKQLTAEESDVLNLANPVIEALQFQDKVTQQMENMVRMIAVWAAQRSHAKPGPELLPADKIAFGEALLACTTMPSECDAFRLAIPELPEEKSADSVTLF